MSYKQTGYSSIFLSSQICTFVNTELAVLWMDQSMLHSICLLYNPILNSKCESMLAEPDLKKG